jgi:VTC domain-containing protein
MDSNGHASNGNGNGNAQGVHKPLVMQRWEVKYVVDRTTRTGLERDLSALMRPDAFAGNDGTYIVRSLYFDSPDYMAFHSKVSGDAVRHKVRTRIYTDDPSQAAIVRLEVKSRILATIHKVACDVSREEYLEIWEALQRRTLPRDAILDNHPGVADFFRLQKQYSMEPKVIVQYRRKAWERRDISRVRTNFDDEIVASRHTDLLGDLHGARRLMQYGHSVFEIKVDGVMPYWLHMLTDKYGLRNEAFSKFCYSIASEARTSAAIRRD